MIWQDVVIMIVNVALGYALVPQIIDGFRRKRCDVIVQTSLVSFVCLIVMAVAVFTLGLYLSAAVTFIDGIFWGILFVQRLVYK